MFVMATDSGPTWLAVVGVLGIGTVLSAAITAGSLIYQNGKNAEREQQRRDDDVAERQKDREHQVDTMKVQAELTQREAAATHYRSQKQEAHTVALRALIEALDRLHDCVRTHDQIFRSTGSVARTQGNIVRAEVYSTVRDQLIILQLLSSSKTVGKRLGVAYRLVSTADSEIRNEEAMWDLTSRGRMQALWENTKNGVDRYAKVARVDIDVEY